MSLGKPASIVRVSIAFHRTSPGYSRKTFLFCRPLYLWMLLKKLKIRESHQGNLQTLKTIKSIVAYITIQYSAVQYSTVQCSAAQYSTSHHSTAQDSTVQCSIVQYTLWFRTVQYSTVQCSTVHHSTMQCNKVQYCHSDRMMK